MRSRPIHLFNTLKNIFGGSELQAVEMFSLLSHHAEVTLWHRGQTDPALTDNIPARQIAPWRGDFPRRGDMVFVGAYFRLRSWFALTRPGRVVVLHNTDEPERLLKLTRRIRRYTRCEPEIVYCSRQLAERTGIEGQIQYPLIDTQRFHPELTETGATRFRVGRLSPDKAFKHGEDDPLLYRRLAQSDMQIEIMGGQCLTGSLEGVGSVHLLPASLQPECFLRSLDAFVYRTRSDLFEAFGRVVIEAMASGLPVVCHARGGYVDFIEHGKTGFLFETNDEAFMILERLKDDVSLRNRIGAAARAAVVEKMATNRERILNYYL